MNQQLLGLQVIIFVNENLKKIQCMAQNVIIFVDEHFGHWLAINSLVFGYRAYMPQPCFIIHLLYDHNDT